MALASVILERGRGKVDLDQHQQPRREAHLPDGRRALQLPSQSQHLGMMSTRVSHAGIGVWIFTMIIEFAGISVGVGAMARARAKAKER